HCLLEQEKKTSRGTARRAFTKASVLGEKLESDSSSVSSTEPKKVRSIILARGEHICLSSLVLHLLGGWHSSQSGLYSLESRSGTKSSSCKLESLSICEELEYLHHDYPTLPSDYYEDHLIEFGSHADCSCSEYQNDGTEHHCDKDLRDLLYSNGVAPINYVLSSGRWSVAQDTQPGTRKLTIDKEFEQYFSSLML
ncbi:UNVERIFIED_CONTAM: protein FAR-RED ELONGATED HYPOCOTYL 1, partial [Sesamum radiatum]